METPYIYFVPAIDHVEKLPLRTGIIEIIKDFPKEQALSFISFLSEDSKKWAQGSFDYVIQHDAIICWKPSPELSLEQARRSVEKYEESLIPVYVDTKLEINAQLVHHFFDSRVAAKNGFAAEIRRAYNLAAWLVEKSHYSGSELLDPQDLVKDFPHAEVDWSWPIETHMWTLLNDALKKERKISETTAGVRDFRSQLAAMLTVLREMLPFARDKGETLYPTFISLLRAPTFGNTVVMGITTWFTPRDNSISQQRITQFPTMWLYRVMHPGCCVAYERIAMLMHSITSHAALQQWPEATTLQVVQPMPKMLQLLETGAKEHGFSIEKKHSYVYLPLKDSKYMELWRKWTALPSIEKQAICAICWKLDADWQCGASHCPKDGQQHYYCGTDCAQHDWNRHVRVDKCYSATFGLFH